MEGGGIVVSSTDVGVSTEESSEAITVLICDLKKENKIVNQSVSKSAIYKVAIKYFYMFTMYLEGKLMR